MQAKFPILHSYKLPFNDMHQRPERGMGSLDAMVVFLPIPPTVQFAEGIPSKLIERQRKQSPSSARNGKGRRVERADQPIGIPLGLLTFT
jgi:hypothetical protein